MPGRGGGAKGPRRETAMARRALPGGREPEPADACRAKRRQIDPEIGDQVLRLGAQELATDLVMGSARAFKHRHGRVVAGELQGEGCPREPTTDRNEWRLLHPRKLGVWLGRSRAMRERRALDRAIAVFDNQDPCGCGARCPLPGLAQAIIKAERFGSENAFSERAAFLARVAGDDPASLRRLGGHVPVARSRQRRHWRRTDCGCKSGCGPKCRQAQKQRQ
jgi:hypothetical protein